MCKYNIVEYLIERLQETDSLLEVCESDSAPVGWRCNWSRKEKQYYYIHEITDELSWTYPEEDVDAVRKLASQESKKAKQQSSGRTGTLSHLTQDIEVRTVDADLKSLFLQKIVDKCTDVAKENTEKAETKSEGGSPEKERADKEKSKTESKEQTNKSSKRQHSTESASSPKHKKSKHKHKNDGSDKKNKKHSKHKKTKSSSKKSKHKRQRSDSESSIEAGELRPRKPDKNESKHRSESRTSPPRVKTPDSSPTSIAARQRLSSKIFKLDHSRGKLKTRHRSPVLNKTTHKETDKISVTLGDIVRKSPVPSSKQGSKQDNRMSPKSESPLPEHRSPSPPPNPPSADSPKSESSSAEMDISPISSRASTPEPEISQSVNTDLTTHLNLAYAEMHEDAGKTDYGNADSVIDNVFGKKAEGKRGIDDAVNSKSECANSKVAMADVANTDVAKVDVHIDTEDDMDSFLQSIQRDMLEEKAATSATLPAAPMVLAPTAPTALAPAVPSALAPTATALPLASALPVPSAGLPPPLERKEMELPPSQKAEQYSKAAAPVFYKPTTEQPQIVANAPVLYTAPAYVEPAIPELPSSTRGVSPVRFPETASTAEQSTTVDTSKQVKEKHKSKKSHKKSNKMPAALVQKWQKVQSEISTDIEKEKRLKHDLFN